MTGDPMERDERPDDRDQGRGAEVPFEATPAAEAADSLRRIGIEPPFPVEVEEALLALLHQVEYSARHLEEIPARVRVAAVRARNFIPWGKQ